MNTKAWLENSILKFCGSVTFQRNLIELGDTCHGKLLRTTVRSFEPGRKFQSPFLHKSLPGAASKLKLHVDFVNAIIDWPNKTNATYGTLEIVRNKPLRTSKFVRWTFAVQRSGVARKKGTINNVDYLLNIKSSSIILSNTTSQCLSTVSIIFKRLFSCAQCRDNMYTKNYIHMYRRSTVLKILKQWFGAWQVKVKN